MSLWSWTQLKVILFILNVYYILDFLAPIRLHLTFVSVNYVRLSLPLLTCRPHCLWHPRDGVIGKRRKRNLPIKNIIIKIVPCSATSHFLMYRVLGPTGLHRCTDDDRCKTCYSMFIFTVKFVRQNLPFPLKRDNGKEDEDRKLRLYYRPQTVGRHDAWLGLLRSVYDRVRLFFPPSDIGKWKRRWWFGRTW